MRVEEQKKAGLSAYLKEFDQQNRARPTRLGEMKAGETDEEFWLEDGLPLAGISLETKGENAPLVQIMLGGMGETERSMAHVVAGVRNVRLQLAPDGHDDSLEIEDLQGKTTILRFE
jgi:hypothetical protein